MGVATFNQNNFTTDDPTTYKGKLDGNTAVLAGIADDFAPHQAATPNMTVVTDAGGVMVNGNLVTQAQQTTSTITAPASNPRIDRVVIDAASGAVSVVTGTEAASPTPPAIPAGKLPVAQVSLSVGQNSIVNANLTDERTAYYAPAPDYAADTGAADAYVASVSPPPPLVNGITRIKVLIGNANATTTPTLNYCSTGTKTIYRPDGSAVQAGDLPAGCMSDFVYYSNGWRLMNPSQPPAKYVTQDGKQNYAAAGGSADAYTVILSPAPAALTTGMEFNTYVPAANLTTTPTINVNSLGAKTITRPDGTAVAVGDMSVNYQCKFRYNGAYMILLNPAKLPAANITGTVGASQVSALLGAWNSGWALNTVYGPVSTDIMVTARITASGGAAMYAGVTDSNASPTTERGRVSVNDGYTGLGTQTLTFPVRKGDYWKINPVSVGGSPSASIQIIPSGS